MQLALAYVIVEVEDGTMVNAIELLRATADKCERRAKAANDQAIAAELADMTAQWHWLAGEAAKLLISEPTS